jgi:hypothetical protein
MIVRKGMCFGCHGCVSRENTLPIFIYSSQLTQLVAHEKESTDYLTINKPGSAS